MKISAKKIIKPIFSAAALLSAALLTLTYLIGNHLPDHFQVVEGSRLTLNMPVQRQRALSVPLGAKGAGGQRI